MLAAMLAFLRYRGWRVNDLKIQRTLLGTLGGILFTAALLVLLVIVIRESFKYGLLPLSSHLPRHPRPHADLFIVILNSVVNSYYEEITMMAYAFNQFAVKWGPGVAILVIVVVRVLFHLWKDPIYLPFTAVHFLLSALIYYRWRNIWPLILSHALYDIFIELPDSRM